MALSDTTASDAAGTKLNLPLPRGARDQDFHEAWALVEAHLCRYEPEFLIFHCGADSIAGDPLADLELTPDAHSHAAKRLVALAERYARGRMMVFRGGGYSLDGVVAARSGVLKALMGQP